MIDKILSDAKAVDESMKQAEVVEFNLNLSDRGVLKKYSFQKGSGAFGSLFSAPGDRKTASKTTPKRMNMHRKNAPRFVI